MRIYTRIYPSYGAKWLAWFTGARTSYGSITASKNYGKDLSARLLVAFSLLSFSASSNSELTTGAVLQVEADLDYGAYLSGECLTCHQTTNSATTIPNIHGKNASAIINALLEYRNKTRSNETMQSVALALGKEELAALALYFSVQSSP